MRAEGLRAQVGYGSKPRYHGGLVGVVGNVLNRAFTPAAPNRVRATDATMISDLMLKALVAAVWRCKPGPGVLVHSDPGCQFNSSD